MNKKFITVIYMLSGVTGLLILLLVSNGIISDTYKIFAPVLGAVTLILVYFSGREDRRNGTARERGIAATDERGLLINASAGNTVYLFFMCAFVVAAGVCHAFNQLVAGNILFGFYIGGIILKSVIRAHYRKKM